MGYSSCPHHSWDKMARMLLAAISLLALGISATFGANKGSIQVDGFGEVFVIAPDWANIYVGDNVFSYSVDVSNVGCSCNAAAYFINMPGNNAGDGDYYCDANFGNNIWCPEYDTSEGNKYTIAGTLHTCSGGNGNWDNCDRNGCQTNIFNIDSNLMCPEDRCTINTNKWFGLKHFQNEHTATITLEQDGKEYTFDICSDAGYVSNMVTSYGGMVYSGSLWG